MDKFVQKALTALGLFFIFATPALAQYEANTLDTLHFRTAQGNVLGHFDFNPDVYYRGDNDRDGILNTTGMRTYLPLDAAVTYGITDHLSIDVSEGFVIHTNRQTDHNTTNTTTIGSAGGFSDPVLGLNYRYLGDLDGTLFANAFVNYSPSVGDARGSGYPGGGNDLRGSSTVTVGTNVYGVMGSQEWSAGVNGSWEAEGNTDGATDSADTLREKFTDYGFHLDYRYHLNPMFFVDALGTFDFGYSTDLNYFNQVAHSEHDDYPFRIVPRLAFGFLPTPSCLLTLGIAYSEYTRDYTQTQGATTTNYSSELKELSLNFGVSYLFH